MLIQSKLVSGLACLLFILSGTIAVFSQDAISREYQVKSVFLYNFSHFVEWQNTPYNNPSDPFIIGIYGDDPFGSYLNETVKGEKVLGHPIVVQRYSSTKDVKNCHILYINVRDNRHLREVLSQVSGKSVLTVSDTPDFAKSGGIIQFFTEKNKTRLLINIGSAKSAGLNISSKLLRLAETLNTN